MPLRIEGKILSGFETLDRGITDIELVTGAGGPKLVTASGPEGGLASYSLRADLLPVFGHNAFYVSSFVSGGGHDILVSNHGGETRVHVTGVTPDGLTSFRMNDNGSFSSRQTIDNARFGDGNAVAAETDSGLIVMADPEGSGFAIYDIRQDWALVNDRKVEDTGNTNADRIGDIETVRIGSSDIIVVASQSEHGVTAYRMVDGEAVAMDSVGRPEGLGIMVPTDIEIVEAGGNTYLIVASEPSGGNSGALTVMRIRANGTLEPTDHVIDTLDSRFGDVQHISTATVDGHTYVVAAGGDGGLTLFELLPNGQLVHLESLEGTAEMPLGNVTALEIAVVGNELQIFVATEADAGISVLSYDYRGRGDVLIAEEGGDYIIGTGQADVIVDGSGRDKLRGGGGADLFVLTADD
ncbi:MAG: hypothetical protein RIG84_14165 [Roseovarius sp.]